MESEPKKPKIVIKKSTKPVKIAPKSDDTKSHDTVSSLSSVVDKSTISTEVESIYRKMEQHEHVLEKPGMYIGDVNQEEYHLPIIKHEINPETNESSPTIIYADFKMSPGFYKCFDELAVNMYDHFKRQQKLIQEGKNSITGTNLTPVTTMKITVNADYSIEFFNDGDGIHIVYMDKFKMYPPELIFGSLLTSTNYDNNTKREWGGTNGLGAKLANIYSTKFILETVDKDRELKFYQEFSNNMYTRSEPKITSYKQKPYTKITWYPDYSRFSMDLSNPLTDEMKGLIERRAYDFAGVTDKIKVFFNDKQLVCKNFQTYCEMYFEDPEDERIYEENEDWQIIAAPNKQTDTFFHVSFVNGIFTNKGGHHITYICDQIVNKLSELLKKKRKLDVKPQYIKNNLMLFINAKKIINPTFSSQSKEELTTTKSKFGSTIEISDKFIEKLSKTQLVDAVEAFTKMKEGQLLEKTDGKMKKRINIPKYSGAHKAGTKDSKDCTIIFTEGDSAKTMAISGISVVGRDHYGVYPLRGKIVNVREEGVRKMVDSVIFNNIKQIIGLQMGVNYKEEYEKTGKWPLRYGRLLLMTDQDTDGSHIKGLMINIFDYFWPELFELGFVCCLATPIVKMTKGTGKNPQTICFYTLSDFETWRETNQIKGWNVKYLKGLGSSNSEDAKTYFRTPKIVQFIPEKLISDTTEEPVIVETPVEVTEEDKSVISAISKGTKGSKTKATMKKLGGVIKRNKIDLAFNKKRADDRKEWLKIYDRKRVPNYNEKEMPLDKFIDDELIHFAVADIKRSIPDIRDGLKESHRKVLYSTFKRNLVSEFIKVSQLAGYVSEHSAYHHGEVSLEGTIKGMAQTFVGANNLNLLQPDGQFGTRLEGGDDGAQTRYIFTRLNKLTRLVFRQADDKMCTYLDDDGFPIEPVCYYPIIPMILVNGSKGIGTGYSTNIWMHNPIDIINHLKLKMDNMETPFLKPWFRGFRGDVITMGLGDYVTKGKWVKLNDTTIRITELPIEVWTGSYIEFLNSSLIEKDNPKGFIKDFIDNSTESSVCIDIKFDEDTLYDLMMDHDKDGNQKLETVLKLIKKISSSNMVLFDTDGKIKKYATVNDIIDEWYEVRLGVYEKRRQKELDVLKKEFELISWKVKFILSIVENKLEIRNKKKMEIEKDLEENGFPKLSKNSDEPSYDYLLKMDLYKLTHEEIEKLKKEQNDKEIEVGKLEGMEAKEIWRIELDELLNAYRTDLSDFEKEYYSLEEKKKIVIKKTK